MGIKARIEQFGTDPGVTGSRIFHATEDGLMTLCDTPISTAGLIAPPAGSDGWPPEVGEYGASCPQCLTNVVKRKQPK
jgi:hypothetical protein